MDLDKIVENRNIIYEAGSNVNLNMEGFKQTIEQYLLAKSDFEVVVTQLKEANDVLTEMLA